MWTAENPLFPELTIRCFTSHSKRAFCRKVNSQGTPGLTYTLWFEDVYGIGHLRGKHTPLDPDDVEASSPAAPAVVAALDGLS